MVAGDDFDLAAALLDAFGNRVCRTDCPSPLARSPARSVASAVGCFLLVQGRTHAPTFGAVRAVLLSTRIRVHQCACSLQASGEGRTAVASVHVRDDPLNGWLFVNARVRAVRDLARASAPHRAARKAKAKAEAESGAARRPTRA